MNFWEDQVSPTLIETLKLYREVSRIYELIILQFSDPFNVYTSHKTDSRYSEFRSLALLPYL
jgi:hypothetical protein